MKEFTTNNKFNFKEYLLLQLSILYSKTWIKVLTSITILYGISYMVFLLLHRTDILDYDLYDFGLVLIVAEIYLPIMVFLICLLGFKRNPRIKESIVYNFSENGFVMKGESFNATFNWASFYKIQTFKGWLVLYQSSMTANFVKLGDDDLLHLLDLKNYLESQNFNVKIKM